jgi:hypothetical protein
MDFSYGFSDAVKDMLQKEGGEVARLGAVQ